MKFKATLRMIWGLAKSPDLSMSDEELHLFVEARTGKSSLKELTQRERNDIAMALIAFKEPEKEQAEGRGNPVTQWQRVKLQNLAKELGWENPARLNGLVKKMFGVARVEWLDYIQCSKLIEALKAIKRRESEKGALENRDTVDDRHAADQPAGSGSRS